MKKKTGTGFLFFIIFLLITEFAATGAVMPDEWEYPDTGDYIRDGKYDYSRIDAIALDVPEYAERSPEKLAGYLIRNAHNDREKARLIYRWITENISYDVDKFFSGDYKRSGNLSAEEVLRKRKAVCGGYAALYKKIATLAGLECHLISGYSKLSDEKLARKMGSELVDHAWNVIKIDGKWRFIESTWGAGNLKADSRSFEKKFKEFYFLTPADVFIYSHFPEESSWQLIRNKCSREKFKKLISPGEQYFNLGYEIDELPNHNHHIYCQDRVEFILPLKKGVRIISNMKKRNREIKNRTFSEKLSDQYRITAYFPSEGEYTVGIFGKYDSNDGMFPMMLQYKITAQSGIKKNIMELACPVTLSEDFFEYGFSVQDLKYSNFRIRTEGKVTIELQGNPGLILMAELKRGKRKVDSGAFVEADGRNYKVTAVPPERGIYVLDIYGRCGSAEGLFPHLMKYHLEVSRGISLKEAGAIAPVQKFRQFAELGFGVDGLSHKNKRINCGEKLKLKFESSQMLDLMARLKKGSRKIENATFIKSSSYRHHVYVKFSGNGDYILTVFARPRGSDDQYAGVIKYDVTASGVRRKKRGYPILYKGYTENECILYSPLNGFLKLNEEHQFRIKVPEAEKVAVVCDGRWIHLESAGQNVFHGSVNLNSEKIVVYAKFDTTGNYSGILSYTGVR